MLMGKGNCTKIWWTRKGLRRTLRQESWKYVNSQAAVQVAISDLLYCIEAYMISIKLFYTNNTQRLWRAFPQRRQKKETTKTSESGRLKTARTRGNWADLRKIYISRDIARLVSSKCHVGLDTKVCRCWPDITSKRWHLYYRKSLWLDSQLQLVLTAQ